MFIVQFALGPDGNHGSEITVHRVVRMARYHDLQYISCLQMTDTGLFVNCHPSPDPERDSIAFNHQLSLGFAWSVHGESFVIITSQLISHLISHLDQPRFSFSFAWIYIVHIWNVDLTLNTEPYVLHLLRAALENGDRVVVAPANRECSAAMR